MSFTFNVDDLYDFADDALRASAEMTQVAYDTAMSAGFFMEGHAKTNAQDRHKKGTGTMATTIETFPKSVGLGTATAEVVAPAVSGHGFPYPIVVDKGRGPIVAKKGKALAFKGDDGKIVRVRSVGAYPGSRFWSDALALTEQELDGFADDAGERLVAMLRD